MNHATKLTVDQRLRALNEFKRNEAWTLIAQAMSYVWGFQDGAHEKAASGEAWEFSQAFGAHALDYLEGHTSSRTNIPDAFKSWRASGVIAS